jgi:RNA polymerase sigma-70 factor (ECF subfamily)
LQRIIDAQGARNDDDFASPVGIEGLAAGERNAAVHAALAKLNQDERRAISLAFFDGLTHEEIATALRTPVGTIKARIRRGLLKLKPALARVRQPDNL